ncbi:MAG: FAD-binding oxidoreductase, partial [Rhodobacteraceae bacterium]
TNGYSGPLHGGLARSVVPVRSVQVATAPLSENLRGTILPERNQVSDMARLLLYFRVDARGRFIMGGRGTFRDTSTRAQMEALRAASLRVFPQLRGVEWTHAWGGNVAITPDHFPHLHELAPGLAAGLGYNGRGVAMATAMGRELARWARGTAPADLDYPVTPLRPLPLHGLHRLGVSAEILRMRLLDRLGL